jgi:hypothetical protein
MKWVLLAIMTGSTGTGPTIPVFMTAEFGDREACVLAANNLNKLTRSYRVFNSNIEYGCTPYATEPSAPPPQK